MSQQVGHRWVVSGGVPYVFAMAGIVLLPAFIPQLSLWAVT